MITVIVTNRLRGTGVFMASISLAKSKQIMRLASASRKGHQHSVFTSPLRLRLGPGPTEQITRCSERQAVLRW